MTHGVHQLMARVDRGAPCVRERNDNGDGERRTAPERQPTAGPPRSALVSVRLVFPGVIVRVRRVPAALRMGLWPELTYFYYYGCVRGPQRAILVFLYHYLRLGTTFRPSKHP